MVPAPPSLPNRFPCWCRAVYSFSGESRRDLGFIEGDLIECLNAGDGSWWMGRLWRDKRMVGLFPSNFVQVLEENFRPTTRSSSPMPDQSPSPNPFNPQPPQKSKSKTHRKPFQAYAAPDQRLIKRAELQKKESLSSPRGPSPNPRGGAHSISSRAPPSPQPQRSYTSRVASPAAGPSRTSFYSPRAPSPAPPPSRGGYHEARAPSPIPPPSRSGYYEERAPSPLPPPSRSGYYEPRATSPLPPPSRSGYYDARAPSPAPAQSPSHRGYYDARAPSPAPAQSTSRMGHYDTRAPSPLPPPSRSSYYEARAPSPSPSYQYQNHSRGPSPAPPFDDDSSSPPPPPPPHRSTYTSHATRNSYDAGSDQYHTPRAVSPCPPSPAGTGMTPSPLRSAMDDVMSSLADMGVAREKDSPQTPIDPWSPEAFDQAYISSSRTIPRPTTADREEYDHMGNDRYGNRVQQHEPQDQPQHQAPPQLSNYVQRMENRLSKMYSSSPRPPENDSPPAVPPKTNPYDRPKSSMSGNQSGTKLRHRKSAYEVGRQMLGRTFTTKTDSTTSSSGTRSTTTNSSSSTQMTDRSIMSGPSAGGFSSTSAGSLARKREHLYERAQSAIGSRRDRFMGGNSSSVDLGINRSQTPLTGISYHSSHASDPSRMQSPTGWPGSPPESNIALGGLMAPKSKKSGFFKKILESAKTGAASARSSIAAGEISRSQIAMKSSIQGSSAPALASGFGNTPIQSPASELGPSGGTMGIDWVQVRRDVNRSNSLSRIERVERKERCQMMDYPAISPVEELLECCDGDEGADGNPVVEPTNFQAVNLSLVDKNTRFINSLPPMTNPISLATGFVCRPYRSDVQRLRAIFTWVSEKITWEEGFDSDANSRRVIQSKHGCSEDVAFLVMEMCTAVGIQAEVIRGYLKPIEICWTHIPEQHAQQHLCPPVAHEILLALPCACPGFFKNEVEMVEYDTSLIRIEDLELVHIKLAVPPDVECVAEVEARAFERDADGDLFESGEVVKKRALSQAEWVGGQKRYTIKALLPGDEGFGTLKIYAGKRGLMHSIKDIPHSIALALPIIHTGDNPPYEFFVRHPTPHAQRHDLYVAQPQCQRLAINNTFVFAVRQHPSSLTATSPDPGRISPVPFIRPSSAMSLSNSSVSGSGTGKKPAKLAIQAPGGKILRLMRKEERNGGVTNNLEGGDGGTWETIIKCGERGVWRGLVLADRSARWCVFAEWTCV
ncbi:variant SH3 domain-containing protein [Rutstroemia sp. NJR-2017a WRK4]|nr:variant SH3 domain-containing protein [Rutstroemia sp. NJR-2017a WRK4]